MAAAGSSSGAVSRKRENNRKNLLGNPWVVHQHTVAQSYLRFFSLDRAHVHRFDKSTPGPWKRLPIQRVAAVNGFYDFPASTWDCGQLIELHLGAAVDGPSPAVVSALVERLSSIVRAMRGSNPPLLSDSLVADALQRIVMLSEADRLQLARLVASQMVRTPRGREGQVAALHDALRSEAPEIEHALREALGAEWEKAFALFCMLDGLKKLPAEFMRYQFRFFFDVDGGFLTSDHPVVELDSRHPVARTHRGVYMPLTPQLVLMIDTESKLPVEWMTPAPYFFVDLLNVHQFVFANRFVYGRGPHAKTAAYWELAKKRRFEWSFAS